MIPRILHQTWKTARVPRAFRGYVASFSKFQQLDWRLYDDAQLRALVVRCFPQHVQLYDAFTRNLERVDFARYVLMHAYGGIYADLDMECLKPLDPLLAADGPILGTEPSEHAAVYQFERIVCNAILFSPPGHPLWANLLDYIAQKYRPHGNPVYNTGPLALTSCLRDHPQWFADAQILPPPMLYPQVDKRFGGKRDGRFFHVSWECQIADAYATHHWAHTNDTLLDSLKTTLRNTWRGLRPHYRVAGDGRYDARYYQGPLAAHQRRDALVAALAELQALVGGNRIDVWLLGQALGQAGSEGGMLDGTERVELGVHYNHLFLLRTIESSHPRYLLDVNPNHVMREWQPLNPVDARFIDKQTGVFVDLFGYRKLRNKQYIGSKRGDRFRGDDIYPLGPCQLNGCALKRPHHPQAVLGGPSVGAEPAGAEPAGDNPAGRQTGRAA